MQRNNRQSTGTRSRTGICDTFWGALAIILLSTLPYFHDIITDSEGLRPWVPDLGVERLLTGSDGKILGFSTYRVFLYTTLIFVFSAIGWLGWYRSSAKKMYQRVLLVVVVSSAYHVLLILFDLRRTFLNGPGLKVVLLLAVFLLFVSVGRPKGRLNLRNILAIVLLLAAAMLPFLHDLITDRAGAVRSWVPDLGIERLLTDGNGMVRGLRSYRLFLYLFGIYLFAHIGWIGWFFDAAGRKYRTFILVPAILSLYQVVTILMSWRETKFNDPSIHLVITLILALLLAFNFYYNNKVSPKTEVLTENENN